MRSFVICFIALWQTVSPAVAQEFVQYPASWLDRQQRLSGVLTGGSYEKVYNFYKNSTHWVQIQRPFICSISEVVRVNHPSSTQLTTHQRRSVQ